MFHHKVIDLLRSFSKEEINKFKKFIHSPYFNRSRKVIALFNELIKFYPEFKSKKLTNKNLYQNLVPERTFNDSTFRSLCFDLQNLIFTFLSSEHLKDNEFRSANFLLYELNIRGQHELYRRILKRMENEMDQSNNVDFDYFYDRYIFESYKYNYHRITGKVLNKQHALSQLNQLTRPDGFLTLMFITELICDFINIVILSDKYNLDLSNNITFLILKSLDLNKLIEALKGIDTYNYITELYSALYSTYISFNKKQYLAYKEKVKLYEERLSFDEKSFHYSKLISFCIMKNNNDSSAFFEGELFRLYEYFLMNQFYINKKIKYIPHTLFRAILQLALNSRKYYWAENFIKIYHKKVEEKNRLNMFYYGYTLYYNKIGKQEKSLEFIEKINIDNFIFKYDLYNLKLKILFDLNNSQMALDLIKTYREFLRKDTLFSEEKKIPHKNFVKFLSYLINYSDGMKNYELSEIKERLLKEENINSREWLIGKIDQLERIGVTWGKKKVLLL